MTSKAKKQAEAKRKDETVLVARIASAHGIKGLVKIQSLTGNPEDFTAYAPLVDGEGKEVKFEVKGASKGSFLAQIEGVDDRNAAEALKGTGLYAFRCNMGEMSDDEFFSSDIIGFEAVDESDTSYGSVKRVLNYGSSDLLEVEMGDGRTFLVPYSENFVKSIDFEGGRIVILAVDQLLDLAGVVKK